MLPRAPGCRRVRAHVTATDEIGLYLTEGGTVVDGGGLGDEADAGGILGDLGDTEPVGGVATGLLVGSGPHGEREGNPEADDLPPQAADVTKLALPDSSPLTRARPRSFAL